MSEEDKSLADFSSKALRGPKTGAYQQLLSQKLIKSIQTKDPLQKIVLTCEAAYLCKNKDKLEMDKIEAVFKISNSLINTEVKPDSSIRVAWSFPKTEENYNRFFKPWQLIELRFNPHDTIYRVDNYPEKPSFHHQSEYDAERTWELWDEVNKEILKHMDDMSDSETFFIKCSAIGRSSFFSLRGEFESWALPIMLNALSSITEEIDPEVYKDMLSQMKDNEPEEKGE